MKKYKPNTRGAVIPCVKKMDISSLPLCSRVIKEKPKWTNYICSIWNNATIANPPNFHPKNCGWVLENNTFKINLLEEKMFPTTVKIICPENEGDISSVITVVAWLWKKKMIIMKTVVTNPILIMTTTTSVTVIFRSQKPIASDDGSQQCHPQKNKGNFSRF